uniref:Uncharacterized protein n=1 Tax=Arundo donax TaxID=35708 RepID=A0A0A8YUK7_ARUDO
MKELAPSTAFSIMQQRLSHKKMKFQKLVVRRLGLDV